jgi:hypothetical protein
LGLKPFYFCFGRVVGFKVKLLVIFSLPTELYPTKVPPDRAGFSLLTHIDTPFSAERKAG